MKFLADMGISPRTVDGLRRMGYDAVHLVEEGLERLTDETILVKAQNEGRIILTMDLTLAYLKKRWAKSIMIFRQTFQDFTRPCPPYLDTISDDQKLNGFVSNPIFAHKMVFDFNVLKSSFFQPLY